MEHINMTSFLGLVTTLHSLQESLVHIQGLLECLGITKSSRKSDLQKKGQSLTFDQLLAHRTPQTLISKLVCF